MNFEYKLEYDNKYDIIQNFKNLIFT